MNIKTNTKALKYLIDANKMAPAPYKTQRQGKHYEVIIGIGNDHIATLTLDEDAYIELCKIELKSIEV